MYALLTRPADLRRPPTLSNVTYAFIHQPLREDGETHFLHGVSVEQYQGELFATWGDNSRGVENSVTEVLRGKRSGNGGETWGKPFQITRPDAPFANSHSVLLAREDGLWCFGPNFGGLGKRKTNLRFMNLFMEAWRWQDDAKGWQAMGRVADDLWPLSVPARMANGNWLVSGCDEDWLAAVAVSHGDDLLYWDVVRLPTGGKVLTEAGAWIQGNKVLAVLRNESILTDGNYHAVVSLSEDYGQTFGPCEVGNLPMATTKPFCGVLEDGRPYLVFNLEEGYGRGRGRMLLGIGAPGALSIDRVYVLDAWAKGLSYPYARQFGDQLYIVYSLASQGGNGANHNDAKLAVVPLASLE